MGISTAILAGGKARRLGKEKGLIRILGKPMISYVIDACKELTTDIFVVFSTKEQSEKYLNALSDIRVIFDNTHQEYSPLFGAITAFRKIKNDYIFLLPCDTPLINSSVIELLYSFRLGYDAVIPRWPNGYIEPLCATYRSNSTLDVAEKMMNAGRLEMRGVTEELKVLYVSTLAIKKFDPKFNSFYNVNTEEDRRRVEKILRRRK
ncbi:MAG: molybdenum cofactor guanylyltransferase [Candidatus Hodarchaeota archaeon]